MDIERFLKSSLQRDFDTLRQSIESTIWLKMLDMPLSETLKVCSEALKRLSPNTGAVELIADEEPGDMCVKTDRGTVVDFRRLTFDEMYAIVVQLELL